MNEADQNPSTDEPTDCMPADNGNPSPDISETIVCPECRNDYAVQMYPPAEGNHPAEYECKGCGAWIIDD